MNASPRGFLIHIGMVKTATTLLQQIWREQDTVCLVYAGLLKVVEKARISGHHPEAGRKAELKWGYDTPCHPGQKVVFSQEALSTAYMNERAKMSEIKRFQLTAAQLMSQIAPGTKILLTVRQPEPLIRSIYNQSVKQGGVDTFPEFLEKEADFISQTLNPVDLIKFWGNFFGPENILVLPIELLKKNAHVFFKAIEQFSGVNAPGQMPAQKANLSLQPEHLKLMRRFNEWVDLFSRYGVYGNNLPPQVLQALNTIRFAVRYSLEAPSPELMQGLAEVEGTLRECQVDPVYLENDFVKGIKENFSQIIGEHPFYGFRDLYMP